MNFAEAFQEAVGEISYTGDELINAVQAARALLASLPDDSRLEQEQRFRRQNRRRAGEVIDISFLESALFGGGMEHNDGEGAHASHTTVADEGAASNTGATSAVGEVAAPVSQLSMDMTLPSATAADWVDDDDGGNRLGSATLPADPAAHFAASRGSNREGSGFVSPASFPGRNSLLQSEAASSCHASGAAAKAHGRRRRHRRTSSEKRRRRSPQRLSGCDAPHTSSASDTTVSSSSDEDAETKERVRQLELYDQSPSAWLRHLICVGAKLFTEQIENYFHAMHTLAYYMALRRKRVEQRSEYLRSLASREGSGGAAAPIDDAASRADLHACCRMSETAAATACEQGAATAVEGVTNGKTNSDDDDEEDDGEVVEGFFVSREVKQGIRVGMPDNAFRLRDSVNNFFFSCYASVIIQGSVSLAQIKQAAAEIVRICRGVLTWPRYPLNLRAQWAEDREEQFRQFLSKWLGEANGHLVTLMTVPPESPATATRHPGAPGEDDTDNSTTARSSPSAADFASAVADEGSFLHESVDDSDDTSDRGKALQQRVFLGPQTRGEDAIAMAYEFVRSSAPCSTPLARLVADTVPGKGVDTLLPCIEQPERRTFNDGFCRLAPFLSRNELELIAESMQLPLTEMPAVDEDDGGSDNQQALREAEKAIVKKWASPTYDPRGGELTVLINPTNAFRLQLSNPIIFSLGGVQCDMCCVTERRVSFQAVLDSGVRSEVVLEYEGCIGYDVCVACSCYYYKSSEMRLLRAVHPASDVRAPFSFGRFSKVNVHSVRAFACAEGEGEMTVEVVMGVSPYGVMPIGWLLPVDQLAELSLACPTLNEETELTAELHAGLPAPPRDWKQRCSVVNISSVSFEMNRSGDTDAQASGRVGASRQGLSSGAGNDPLIDETDVCPICLQLLLSPLPVLRTLCGHCFHVECIGSHYHYKPAVVDGEVNENNGCPVCRCSEYMPPLTDADAMMRTNVYKLVLQVPAGEVAKGHGARALEWGGGCAIAVGTILTDDGAYHNATNIASCEAFYGVTPGFTFTGDAAAGSEERAAAATDPPCSGCSSDVGEGG
ncbi:hypothetical protein LSCM1_05519 [Leishmania martiniquensis]|uniref:RING-type domain-containing protein n=1 Tax=Leishmania martiniquensis TaxID=1580590 RepID=A0A836GUD4_9TRYP|nr:hypothetical protein LSCM1_05519 [Leishmania martiniquensis]